MKARLKISENSKALMVLLNQHRQFHKYLDNEAAESNLNTDIELLISIRQFNLDCITKYTDLISSSNILSQTNNEDVIGKFKSMIPKGLWGVHRQLSLLARTYATILRSKDLNPVSMLIISNNLDILRNILEDLLHPVSELQPA